MGIKDSIQTQTLPHFWSAVGAGQQLVSEWHEGVP